MLRNALPVPLFFYWSIEFGNGMETVQLTPLRRTLASSP